MRHNFLKLFMFYIAIAITAIFLTIDLSLAGTDKHPLSVTKKNLIKPDTSQFAKPAPLKKISLKIQNFITVVKNADNLKTVSQAFQKANFNSNELKDLEKELRNNKLVQKMDNLKMSFKPVKSKPPIKKINPKALLLKKQQAVKLKNSNMVKRSYQKKTSLKQKPAKKNRENIPYVTAQRVISAQIAPAVNTMAHPGVDLSHLPMISREVEVPINRNSVIHGHNFGNGQGVIMLTLDSPGWGIEEGIILPVISWETDLIRFSVPNDRALVETIGWAHSKPARIWLKVAGEDIYQATARAFVYPDWEMYRMRVDTVSPDTISPGTLITIQGENLGLGMNNQREAAVIRIQKDGEYIRSDIRSFTNNQVVVCVDEGTQGFTSGQAEITIYTRLSDYIWRMEGWHHSTITFHAAEEIKMFENSDSVRCSPKFPRFLCLVGKTHRKTLHNWELKNGWVVDDTVLDVDHRGPGGGAYYLVRPESGSTRARSRIEVWCNAYSGGYYVEYFYIRGPRGVEFR